MRFEAGKVQNTPDEKVFWLIPSIVFRKRFDDWDIAIVWLNGVFIIEF